MTEIDKLVLFALADCDLNISRVAKKLNYHRNNVWYHVEQIKKKTGHNPTRFYDMCYLLKVYGGKENGTA